MNEEIIVNTSYRITNLNTHYAIPCPTCSWSNIDQMRLKC